MSESLRLITDRLELVAGTLEVAEAELSDQSLFARLLEVPVPTAWPPPLNDEQSQRYFLAALKDSTNTGWTLWYCIRREPRELVGSAGFKGPATNGVVEIGYSVLESHQRNGYGTEASRALIAWAFRHPQVQMIIAHNLPELRPSIRVMENCGMSFAGDGPLEDGVKTIRYELQRPRFEELSRR